jgi:hypothetical protein
MASNDLSLLRVFVLESPNPIDMLQGRAEAPTLKTIGSLIGHEVAGLSVYSRQQFIDACEWISSISKKPETENLPGKKRKRKYDAPLCIHISAHGNDEGIATGQDLISWKQLAEDLSPICRKMNGYHGKLIFIISACYAGEQKLTRELQKLNKSNELLDIPSYLFVTADCEIAWQDAAVAWTVFYHQLRTAQLENKSSIQKVLDRIILSCGVHVKYYRWNEKENKYMKWVSTKQYS